MVWHNVVQMVIRNVDQIECCWSMVVAVLKESGNTIVENLGVMTNPTLEKLHEGVKIACENEADFEVFGPQN